MRFEVTLVVVSVASYTGKLPSTQYIRPFPARQFPTRFRISSTESCLKINIGDCKPPNLAVSCDVGAMVETEKLLWLYKPYVPVLLQECNGTTTLGLFSPPMNWASHKLSSETTPHMVTACHLPS